MKATRKLIPAIAMLLISAVMMSTATFAWFTTNGTVEANGITISAKANTTYLMISSTEAGFDTDISKNLVETVSNDGTKYPIVYDGSMWKKAIGTGFSNGTALDGEYAEVTNLDEYVIKQDFFVKVAEGYDGAKNFNLTSIAVNGTSQAISVVVEAGGVKQYTKVATKDGEGKDVHTVVRPDDKNLFDTVGGTALKFTVYVYINGDHPDVTNEKFLADMLNNLTVALTFDAVTAIN